MLHSSASLLSPSQALPPVQERVLVRIPPLQVRLHEDHWAQLLHWPREREWEREGERERERERVKGVKFHTLMSQLNNNVQYYNSGFFPPLQRTGDCQKTILIFKLQARTHGKWVRAPACIVTSYSDLFVLTHLHCALTVEQIRMCNISRAEPSPLS